MQDKNEEIYTSKTKRGECKNENCTNKRENGSSRCAACKANSNLQGNQQN